MTSEGRSGSVCFFWFTTAVWPQQGCFAHATRPSFGKLRTGLNSSSVILTRNGAVAKREFYYPYGGNRGAAFSSVTTQRFTGQYHESALPGGEGLSYYGARWYDAKLGRFLSADMIVPQATNPQAFNRYSYVLNNPLNFTDPTGHDPWGGRREDPRDRLHGDTGLIIPVNRYLQTLIGGGIDRSHWDTGEPGKVIERVRAANQAGGGFIEVEQPLSSFGVAIGFRGTYLVRGGLTEEQIVPVAHGIYRDWSWRFEWWEYTMPTEGTESAFANEDRPTQELGFFQDATGMAFEQMMSYLEPATGSEEQVFETMNPFHPTKNHFFTPRVQNASGQWVNIAWPSALTLTPLGPDSGLWTFQYQQTGWGFGNRIIQWGTPNASIDLPPLPALPPNQ